MTPKVDGNTNDDGPEEDTAHFYGSSGHPYNFYPQFGPPPPYYASAAGSGQMYYPPPPQEYAGARGPYPMHMMSPHRGHPAAVYARGQPPAYHYYDPAAGPYPPPHMISAYYPYPHPNGRSYVDPRQA